MVHTQSLGKSILQVFFSPLIFLVNYSAKIVSEQRVCVCAKNAIYLQRDVECGLRIYGRVS